MNAVHIIVHTPEQVREIVREAQVIADEATVTREGWVSVFEQACVLLGARVTVMQQQATMPVDLAHLNHSRKV